jgi:hypothetical protein
MQIIPSTLRHSGKAAVLLGTVLALAGCATKQPFATQADNYKNSFSQPKRRNTYILQFDVNGQLANFNTLFQAINDIKDSRTTTNAGGPITNIVVLSYGWNHDIDAFEEDYSDLLSNYDLYISNNYPRTTLTPDVPTATICVSWPSGYSMMGKSLTDLVPGSTLPRTLAAPLDVAFPLSVWAKSSLADRIGYGDLPQALEYLYANAYGGEFQPNIYLIGHSFGCRVISGAIRKYPPSPWIIYEPFFKALDIKRSKTTRGHTYEYCRHIKGAVLIQPAMANANLPLAEDCTDFPLLVTQSHYDHLNGVLYPLANIPFNGVDSSFTTFFYRRLPPGKPQPKPVWLYLSQLTFEALRIPFGIADSVEFLPLSYLRGQCWELGRDNQQSCRTNYITSTLAQVPFVKIPIQQLKINSGYQKGLFDLGIWHESAGRIRFDHANILSADQTVNSNNPPTGLTNIHNGIQYVNSDDLVSRSIISDKIDYWNPYWNYTIGQVDPIGSHDDYEPNIDQRKHPQILDWIHFLSLNAMSGHVPPANTLTLAP